jgi:hypothetical protein
MFLGCLSKGIRAASLDLVVKLYLIVGAGNFGGISFGLSE